MVQPLIGIGDVLTRQTFSNRMIYNRQETSLDSFDVIIFKNRVKDFFEALQRQCWRLFINDKLWAKIPAQNPKQ